MVMKILLPALMNQGIVSLFRTKSRSKCHLLSETELFQTYWQRSGRADREFELFFCIVMKLRAGLTVLKHDRLWSDVRG